MNKGLHGRDHELGLALRELDVPEHREAFFAELDSRLRAMHSQRPVPLRRRLRPVTVLAAAACLAGALLVFGVLHVGSGSDVARAAALRARMMKTLATVQTVRGDLVYTSFDARTGRTTTRSQTFAMDAAGDLRVTDVGGPEDLAYDASLGVERAVTTSASIGTGRFYAERTGIAPGAPDAGPPGFALDRTLGAVVRGLAAAHSPRVTVITYDGRSAWQLDAPLEPNRIYADADRLQVTVDEATGFPVHVVTTLHGELRSELRVDRLVVDEPLPADEFQVAFPAGAEVLRTDGGFRHVALADVASAAGYRPFVPAQLPQGFRIETVAVAADADPTGAGGSNPPSRDVVSLQYRRGLDEIVVTTRRRTEGVWTDPFGVEGVSLSPEHVVPGGALGTVPAEIALGARTVPHLWTITGDLVVTVSGDLDRAQLLSVARSLRR